MLESYRDLTDEQLIAALKNSGDPDGKICRLLDFAANPRDIADPWYTGDFDATYTDVCAGCDALLKRLKEQRLVIPAAVRVCHVQMR